MTLAGKVGNEEKHLKIILPGEGVWPGGKVTKSDVGGSKTKYDAAVNARRGKVFNRIVHLMLNSDPPMIVEEKKP